MAQQTVLAWLAVKHVFLLQRNQCLQKQRSEVFPVKAMKAYVVVEVYLRSFLYSEIDVSER